MKQAMITPEVVIEGRSRKKEQDTHSLNPFPSSSLVRLEKINLGVRSHSKCNQGIVKLLTDFSILSMWHMATGLYSKYYIKNFTDPR